MNNNKLFFAVYGLIYNLQREILIVKRAAHDTHPNVWELPGGSVEFGESPQDALKREVKEETNLDININQVITIASYLNKYNDHEKQVIRVAFYSKPGDNSQNVTLSSEHSEYMWIPPFEIKDMLISDFLLRTVEDLKG